jgi:hypothetical protein
MLRRAISSLQAQTYPHWKAVIFDDSSSAESKSVIESVADNRIVYVRNPKRLGAAYNIDQCFSPVMAFGGDFGCLLEDDNFWLPDFLSMMAEHTNQDSFELIQANQRISEEGVGLRPASETTRGGWFSAGTVDPLELRASLFFMKGISNGGLVWRLGAGIQLQVGPKIGGAGLQEACRALLIRRPFLFLPEAQAVCTFMRKAETARKTERNRMIGRGMQSICEFVLRSNGRSVVRIARSLALKLGLTSKLVEAFAYTGNPHLAGELLRGKTRLACRAFAKGWAIRLIEKDPCAAFLRDARGL